MANEEFVLTIEDLEDDCESEHVQTVGELVRDSASAAGQMAVVSKYAVA
jgi:hypothetical protein